MPEYFILMHPLCIYFSPFIFDFLYLFFSFFFCIFLIFILSFSIFCLRNDIGSISFRGGGEGYRIFFDLYTFIPLTLLAWQAGTESHYNFFESLISGRCLRTNYGGAGENLRRIFPAQIIKDCAMAATIRYGKVHTRTP